MTSKEHNRLVGIFLMGHGALQLLIMIAVSIIYAVIGSAMVLGSRRSEEQFVGIFMFVAIFIVAAMSVILVAPQIIGGYKLWRVRANELKWGIVGSVLSCLSFPIGTAAGVYGLWFLFGDEGKNLYFGPPARQPVEIPSPPPPNSWQ